MNWAGGCASLVVAIDCYQKAVGDIQQYMFGPSFLWMWWVLMTLWLLIAVVFFARVVRTFTHFANG